MSDLTTAMVIQVLFSAGLFAFLFYFMSQNSALKKEIDAKLKNTKTNSSED